eukprot:1096852-Rhodomonas_salina.1
MPVRFRNICNQAEHSDVIDTVACVELMEEADENLLAESSGTVQVEQLIASLASPSHFQTPTQTQHLPVSPSESESVNVMPSQEESLQNEVPKRSKYQRGGTQTRNAAKMAELCAKHKFPQTVHQALGTVTASVEHALTTMKAA